MNNLTRRCFIGSSALAFPGLLLASKESRQLNAWRPKQALSSVMFSKLSLEDFCEQAAKIGFKGIDLWGPFHECKHLAEAIKLGPEGFMNLLKTHDLEIGVWTLYNARREFPEFAKFIGACGGGIVVRESSYDGNEKNQLKGSFGKFFDTLQPEIDLARKHNIRLAIENHADAILNTPESFEIFTRLNPAPDMVGLAVAPYHLQKHKADIAKVISTCGEQLLFFYAWQLGKGTKQFPGIGPVDFTPWMQALSLLDYKYWMTPFMHGDLPPAEMALTVAKAHQYLNTLNIKS